VSCIHLSHSSLFFFNDAATTETHTLSLHDALPISYETCREVIEGKPKKLVEAVAETVAAELLTQFPLVQGVRVQLIKPDPPIPGHYKSVAIDITRGNF